MELSVPQQHGERKWCLRMLAYYAQWIKNYSGKVKPLTVRSVAALSWLLKSYSKLKSWFQICVVAAMLFLRARALSLVTNNYRLAVANASELSHVILFFFTASPRRRVVWRHHHSLNDRLNSRTMIDLIFVCFLRQRTEIWFIHVASYHFTNKLLWNPFDFFAH